MGTPNGPVLFIKVRIWQSCTHMLTGLTIRYLSDLVPEISTFSPENRRKTAQLRTTITLLSYLLQIPWQLTYQCATFPQSRLTFVFDFGEVGRVQHRNQLNLPTKYRVRTPKYKHKQDWFKSSFNITRHVWFRLIYFE